MSCNCTNIIEEIAEIKALLLALLDARKEQDVLTQPFHMRAADRRAAAIADRARKDQKKLRQPGN